MTIASTLHCIYRPYIHCVSKNVLLCDCPYLCQILTEFQHSFNGTLFGQFAIKWFLNIPPHHNCVATLLCVPFETLCFFLHFISQGSVATQLWCGGIFKNHFIANCPKSVPVKERWKSVNTCQRYGQLQSGTFFETQCRNHHVRWCWWHCACIWTSISRGCSWTSFVF